ncbi:MAG: hypothetical protein RLZZ511_1977 [Cyanobacteriota bacterium]|jgi:hypothetical protein
MPSLLPLNLATWPQLKARCKSRLRRRLQQFLQPIVEAIMAPTIAAIQQQSQQQLTASLSASLSAEALSPTVQRILNAEIRIWGDRTRLHLAAHTEMVNTLFNLSCGEVWVGDYSFTGHNVSIITGTHNYRAYGPERMTDIPETGRDITIGQGVWIGSNATILGPCTIGDHAVIAAGAVVTAGSSIPAGAIVAGIPAQLIRQLAIPNAAPPSNLNLPKIDGDHNQTVI